MLQFLATGITRKKTISKTPRPKFDLPNQPKTQNDKEFSNAIQNLENERNNELEKPKSEGSNSSLYSSPKLNPKLLGKRMSRLGTTKHLPVKREITEDEKNTIIKQGHILCVKSNPPRVIFSNLGNRFLFASLRDQEWIFARF